MIINSKASHEYSKAIFFKVKYEAWNFKMEVGSSNQKSFCGRGMDIFMSNKMKQGYHHMEIVLMW